MSTSDDLMERFTSSLKKMKLCDVRRHESLTSEREEAVRSLRSTQNRSQLLGSQCELVQELLARTAEVKRRRVECQKEIEKLRKDQQLEEMKQKVKLWEQVSGAWIKITDKQEMRIHFSRLKGGVDTDCYVTLDANVEGLWDVRDCQPTIPGLQTLLNELNTSKDIGKFCRNVRSGFQRIL